ncbi:hypothetical protein B0F90DRAFT_1679910 [Multifurca ochricompacta]|uniref:SMP-LTD domain-containing protein n=1 Tax=Multifurca ochricompacta TaxID=376703 RepID=A0AAD4QTY0_9AGAM|nr:hypothetical protein B0F90DRAFT_1679910 [Multifurca ochricompacta]
MSFRTLVYAYVIGGITFIPLLIISLFAFTIYTSIPVGDPDLTKPTQQNSKPKDSDSLEVDESITSDPTVDLNDLPKTRRGWLTMRRTFEEVAFDGSYVTLMKSFLDSRSKDPKRSRPRDMWYVVLKGKVLYLYEDEGMTECEAAIELSSHQVVIYPEGLLDGELFTKRNAICLKPKPESGMPSVTRQMQLSSPNVDEKVEERRGHNPKKKQRDKEWLTEPEKQRDFAREETPDPSTPWFIFMRSSVEMEDWYLSLIHASEHPANTSMLSPLQAIFSPADMNHLVATLDEQPDVIPMRWLNALLGRIFFSYYNTDALESYVIGRLMKKLSKVKRPNFLSEIVVTEANMGNKPVTFSKPMLKELTKEGDAALELHVQYKGEMRITIKAVATISLGFKPYTVKLVLAVVLRELEGNCNRIWYAFTHMPKMVLHVEPVVSDRQITWGMILNTIESKLKEIILESIVLPHMDDITFFNSSSYVHRGGIWPDAARHEKPNLSNVPPAVDDDVPSASAAADVDPSSSLTPDDLDTQLKRSHSQGDVNIDADPQYASPQSSYHRTTTLPVNRGSSPTPNPTQPHHFLHLREHDLNVEDPDLPTEAALLEAHYPRFRNGGSSSSEKSKKKRFLSIRRTSRSPSPSLASRPSSREPSPTPSLEKPRSSSPELLIGASSSQADTRPTKSPVSSSQPSLLSTLKSRAGDRQALSSTARETMRKWTVSWGGLKKDQDPGAASSEDARDGRDSRNRSASQKMKSSYAEIRAAVDGRREKERRSSDGSSAPMRIPSRGHKERADSLSSGHDLVQESSFSSSQAESSPPPSSAGGSAEPSADETCLPEQSLTRPPAVDVSRMQLDVEDVHGLGPAPVTVISPPTPISPPPRPIQSQPSQGKTMTIPGIHARHRGEVMSMGYAPPSLPASEGKTGVSSVYRLWKHSPTAPAEPADRDGEHARSRSPPSLNAGSAETLPEPSPENALRPTAPPLPPRSPTLPRSVPSAPPSPSPASAALKSIVSRDEESRAGSEVTQDGDDMETPEFSTPAGPKPPLPPRKIHASA